MKCLACHKQNPTDATMCIRCGKPLEESNTVVARPYRAQRIALIITSVLLAAAIMLGVWTVFSKPSQASLVGTWKMEIPVGEAIAYFGETEEENTLANGLLELMGREATVTVYCRFYEDNTYTMYAGYEEIIAASDQAIEATITYLCDEGFYNFLESRDISAETVDFVMQLAGISMEDVEEALHTAIDRELQPLYDKMKTVLMPRDNQSGNNAYLLDDEFLYMALESGKPVEDGPYVIWRFDGKTLTMSSGTFFDTYLGKLSWEKVA